MRDDILSAISARVRARSARHRATFVARLSAQTAADYPFTAAILSDGRAVFENGIVNAAMIAQ